MKFGCCAALAALLVFGAAAEAADLDVVRTSLLPLRERASGSAGRMGPEFLAARDGLRDWIAGRLSGLPRSGDTESFAEALNAEIAAADLGCVDANAPGYDRCTSPGEFDARGYLGVVVIDLLHGLLIVQAETGVRCGFDESLYVYEFVKNRWRLLLDASQKPDAGDLYVTEQIQQVAFSNTDAMRKDEVRLVATGASPSCVRPFTQAHYRVWSLKRGGGASSLLADVREERAYVGRRDPVISARFEDNSLLIEMDVASIDPRRHSRVAVQRLLFGEKSVRPAPPFALTPRDFVEEWLRAPWATASQWTHAEAREALGKLHAEAAGAPLRVSFSEPTKRCDKDENVVQVHVRLPNGERFFRLRNDSVGAYEMRGADSAPEPGCSRADSALDTRRSLFAN